jgi:Uma2 family endonuclease
VFDSSTYLVLDNKDVVKPDAAFFAADTTMRFHKKSAYGIPDIIMECVPDGYANFHRYTKKNVYEAAKVKELWLVDLATQTILVQALDKFGYVDYSLCDRQGVAKSALLPSFSLAGLQVFR